MNQITRLVLAFLAAGATVHAQTSTKCNPTTNDCPADPALGKAVYYDFTKGAPEDFTVADGTKPVFTSEGAEFTIAKRGDAPTMFSKWYMMFGHTEVTLKVAGGTGLVSSLVLLSDDLDEIDWEWLGGKSEEVQTNYFGQGKTTDYTRGGTSPNPNAQTEWHTYALDWTAEHIQWSIDGKVVRTLTPDTAVKGQYPQTPMKFSIGNWVAGDDGQPQGTIDWAGGKIDWTKGPYKMTVKNVKVQDYSTGEEYSYGDKTGTWQSIKSKNGKINSSGTPSDTVSTAKAEGTAVSQTAGPDATHAAVANNPAAGNGTANGTISTGTPAQSTGAPFPINGNSTGAAKPSTTGNAGSGSGSGSGSNSPSSSSSGTPQTGAAARVGAGVGAVALAAAVMIL